MPRSCTICNHERREEINAALVAGDPFRNVSKRFGTSSGALHRHRKDHIPVLMSKAREGRDVEEIVLADDLVNQVRQLLSKTMRILSQAEAASDLRNALGAIREARGCLELQARLVGELKEGTTVNLLVNPEWISVRTVLLHALAPYPEARTAVALALSHAGV